MKGSLRLGPSVPPLIQRYNYKLLSRIVSIGIYLTIREHSDKDLAFDQLATVSGSIEAFNNHNCTFHMDNLTKLSNLSMVGNSMCTLP